MKLGTLCYIRDDGKTLMLHRVKKANDMHEGKWNGLGGKVQPGESPEECVIREIKEESGLEIDEPQLKGVITFPKFDDIEDWYVFVFTTDKFSGELIDSNEGVLKWIPDGQLLDLHLWDGDRIFLKWLDNDGFFSAKFEYNKGRLIKHSVNFYPAAIRETQNEISSGEIRR
ncbi:MAG: NUDIX domain-containing protein [candidate division Zixibacteria bacterium]|nr:NUDIX domain-containing protein [candidate division Zixibacteria bacterium]